MSETKEQNWQSVQDTALPVIGSPARITNEDLMGRVDKSLDYPLRIHATFPTPNALLNIGAGSVEVGDGGAKVSAPMEDSLLIYPGAAINLQTGVITGTGTVKLGGGVFALPSTTLGNFRRLYLVYKSTNEIDSMFDTSVSGYVSLAALNAAEDPGVRFATLGSTPIAYVDLQGIGSNQLKTAGSASNVIENGTSTTNCIFRVMAGGGGEAGASVDERIGGYTKFVGLPGGYGTLDAAIAAAVDGDSILVATDLSISSPITVDKSVKICWMPGMRLRKTTSTGSSALVLSDNEIKLENLVVEVAAGINLNDVIIVNGNDCNISNAKIIVEAGATIGVGYSVQGSCVRTYVEGTVSGAGTLGTSERDLASHPSTNLFVSKKFFDDRLTPVGTIVPYIPGYFTTAANGGFTRVGPTANTVVAVNAFLPANWRVCDGSALTDIYSPFYAVGAFLPNLDDSRFLMGFTAAGTQGGAATATLITANLPSHSHTINHDHAAANTDTEAAHLHSIAHNHGPFDSGPADGGGAIQALGSAAFIFGPDNSIDHVHDVNPPNFTGNSGSAGAHAHSVDLPSFSGTSGLTGSATAFSILPSYLTAFYIMRVK